jgi:hypothetical protein
MHDERSLSQISVLVLYESLMSRCEEEKEVKVEKGSLDFSKRHLDVICGLDDYLLGMQFWGEHRRPRKEFLKENPQAFNSKM